MQELKSELKELVVSSLKLEDVTPESIGDDTRLFDELGLDSIDALELGMAVQTKYGVSIPDDTTARQAFASIQALATYIASHRSAPAGQ